MLKIVAFGEICQHIAVPVTNLQQEFQMVDLDYSAGGSAGVFCTQVAALGHTAMLIGTVGDDNTGIWVRQNLVSLNVDCRYLISSAPKTSRLILLLTSDGAHRILADASDSRLEDLLALTEVANGADYVYLPGFPGYEALLRRLKDGAYRLVCDFGFLPWLQSCSLLSEQVLERIEGVNIAILSGSHFSDTFNHELAMECIAHGVESVLTTLSTRGVLLTTREGTNHFPAILCQPKNTVGAGDALLAGFLVALGENMKPIQALHFAQAVARIKISRLSGPASRIDVEQLLVTVQE